MKDKNRTEIVKDFYTRIDEDRRLEKGRQGQLEYFITMHYIHRYLKEGAKVLETGAGTGRYSVALAKEGFDVSAVELVEKNLEMLKENARGIKNIAAFSGDALDLSIFDDNSFDMTLSFGPMYHLYESADHHKALDEAIRVTKPGGILLVAFLSAHAIICTNYLYDDYLPTTVGIKENFDSDYKTRHFKEQLFTGFDICEFEELFHQKPVEHITTVAVDNVLEIAEARPDFHMTDEDFKAFADYQLHICEKREMLGNSSHLLYICRKKWKVREKEVFDIMMILYDQDEVVEMYGRSKKREGKMEGAVEMCQGFGMTMKDTIAEIAKKFNLSSEDAKTEVRQYWKK